MVPWECSKAGMGALSGLHCLDHHTPVFTGHADVGVPPGTEFLEIGRVHLDDAAGLGIGVFLFPAFHGHTLLDGTPTDQIQCNFGQLIRPPLRCELFEGIRAKIGDSLNNVLNDFCPFCTLGCRYECHPESLVLKTMFLSRLFTMNIRFAPL